jgi:thiaminase
MKAIVEIENVNYGGFIAHNWVLVITLGKIDTPKFQVKRFYLGQDVKFLSRVLGVSASDVVHAIGSNDLRKETTRRKLARYILNSLNIDTKQVKDLKKWELCCQ